jgi:hypothetical protein
MHQFASPVCAVAADQFLQLADEAERAREGALHTINAALDDLRENQDWDRLDKRKPLLYAMRALKQGKLPSVHEIVGASAEALVAARAAAAHSAAAYRHFSEVFEASAVQTSQMIYDLAQVDRFREALIWQNRCGFQTGVKALLPPHTADSRRSKQRQHEELVTNYMQRYCVKNDTIGFFGPVGWARLVPHGIPLSARPGANLLEQRSVYFEQWCIDELAKALGRNKQLRPWLAPRRLPSVYVHGTTLYLPSRSPIQISVEQAAVLSVCNGDRIAKVIAAELSRDTKNGLQNEAQVYQILEQLSLRGLIAWTLEIPFETHPERSLRQRLACVEEAQLRAAVMSGVDEIEAKRDAIARAAGDPERLDRALAELEAAFTRLTGARATRSAGAMYAGRTLVYEDCRRNIELDIGPTLLRALGPPLSLLLMSARWLSCATAETYRTAFKGIYTELAQQAGSPIVDGTAFWRQTQLRLLNHSAPPLAAIMHTLQNRWMEILAFSSEQRSVSYTSEALRPGVTAAFDAPGPGWQLARYHSPDVMIAAASIEAIAQGDYQFVMGELHIGTNTLKSSFFVEQHPAPDELFRALDYDLPVPRVVPVTPRNWFEVSSRTRPVFTRSKDFHLAFANDACEPYHSQSLAIGELVVTTVGDTLVIRTRDGRWSTEIIEFFAEFLSLTVIDAFKLVRPSAHTPRIAIDRLVVSRESWCCAPADLSFAVDKNEADRFIGARRWARAHGVPRFVFVKMPTERKPFYVDLDSPILVNMLAKAIRRAREQGDTTPMTITEMLPTLDQVWLHDAEGQKYTSELRIVALDLTA